MDLGMDDEENAQNLAIRLASIKMEPDESVMIYALRLNSLSSRLALAVERETPGRSPFAVLSTILWRRGLLPDIRDMQWNGESALSMREARDRAHRIETALQEPDLAAYMASLRAAGVPNHRSSTDDEAAATCGTPSSSSNEESFSSSTLNKRSFGKRKRRQQERPVCTWPKCNKPVGHLIGGCYRRIKSQGKAQKERRAQRKKKRAKTSRTTARRPAAPDGYDGSSRCSQRAGD
ncbi:unnamed protein product [Ectocarpus sp. 12 AP-2014]